LLHSLSQLFHGFVYTERWRVAVLGHLGCFVEAVEGRSASGADRVSFKATDCRSILLRHVGWLV